MVTGISHGALPVQESKSISNIMSSREQRYGTISGFVMLMLGHVPKTGDFFVWNGYEFKVTEMKDHRVNRILLHLKGSSL